MKDKLISIDEFEESCYKNWYGSSRKVLRRCDAIKIRYIRYIFSNLLELQTRTKLVDYAEHRKMAARNQYNIALERAKEEFPNIKEFQLMTKMTRL